MNWYPSDPLPNADAKIIRRDPALHYSLGALYLSPADGFDELSTTYDQRLAGNPLFALESGTVLSALPEINGKFVVDIGCGTGRFALQLSRMGAERVLGIDLSEEMLAVASRKAERGDLADFVTWRRGDLLERLPLADNSADIVVCALTLSFLPEVRWVFRELSRVVSPGGSLVVSDYHPHGLAQARAEAIRHDGNKDRSPYLRFTSASGEECRIAQYVHTVSDLFLAGKEAGLTLTFLAEPIADRRISNTYPGLRESGEVPLAIIARFDK
ncbi:MAG: class I SAM-dependent methyltransferase [Fibrella sp.]|nr:class I SAM-dependent methyltransferase [Armatimonadota bacterium]